MCASLTWGWAAATRGTVDQLIALGRQLVKLTLHLVEPALELVDNLVLLGQGRFLGLDGGLGSHLPLKSEPGECIELVGVHTVPGCPEFVGFAGRGNSLVSPTAGVVYGADVVVLSHPEVADGLGDGGLGFTDVLRVVADHLVQHLLRVFGGVQEGVDVGLGELGNAGENTLLHDGLSFGG